MTVTIKQIAQQSGLSIQTVSQILNDKGESYRPDTRERVRQIARELGYIPNSSARAMRRGHFGGIALLASVQGMRSILPDDLLNGIYDEGARHDFHLTFAKLPDEQLTSEGYVPKILREWMVDGLLINYNTEIPPRMIELIEQHRLPAIWINTKQPSDCVYPDDFNGGRQAAEHLLALGHRRIGFANFEGESHYSALDRKGGYTQAMQAAGLQPVYIHQRVSATDRSSAIAMTAWLDTPERLTAVIAYTLHTSRPIAYAAALRGTEVPGGLSLISFDEYITHSLGRPMDTMLLPEYEIGQRAVQMLIRKMEDPSRKLPPCVVPFQPKTGWTTGPPPAE